MLSSNSSCCNQEAIPPFPENDITSSSSFFPIPTSPHMHLDYQHFYLQFLDHQQTTTMAADSDQNAVVTGKAAMRSSKKDRHSKINTARGPRDRRMRLSLDIARKFFDLQDLLGYDKASRTVEWLLRNSGPAIKDLARAHSTDHSSTCEQESVSSIALAVAPSKSRSRREKVKRAVGRATVPKESRTKARERARERTSQKRRLISSEDPKLHGESVSVGLGSNLGYDMQQAHNLISDQQLPSWNPCTVFNYHDQNAVFLNQEDAEFEFSGKAWEAFNSFNISG